MKRGGSLNSVASEVIGSVEVLERKDDVVADDGLDLADDLGLYFSVLEHRLDHQVAILQRAVIGGRRDARQQFVALGAFHAAFHHAVGKRLVQAGLALVGGLLVAVDEHDGKARGGAHLGDAGAHEAGADDADFLQGDRGLVGRTPRTLVELLHGDKQRADHGGRFRRAQDFGEPARLDAQRGVHVELQAFVDDLEDRARGRIIVVGLAAIDRVCRRERHHPRLGVDEPAGQAKTFLVPGRHGLAAGLDPVLGGLDEIGLRHDGVDELHRLGAVELELVALEQELQRVGRLQHARDALGAAGAGEQPDLDLG